jgi:excisionase family DNA binding protein
MKTNPFEQVFEKLLNSKEVGKLFGVSSATVLRMARAGRLPCVKVGNLWRFSVSHLDAWVASGTTFSRKSF